MKLTRLFFIVVLLLVPMTAHAQDDTDLSEEEIEMLDRMIGGFNYRDEVSSYAFAEMNEVTMSLQLSSEDQTGRFNQFYALERGGYLLRDPIGNIKEFFTINLSGEDDERGEYTEIGVATFVGEVIYLQTPDELFTIEEVDDIPDEFSNASLGGLLDDESTLLRNRELLLSVLGSVIEEEAELDGETMSLLTFRVAEDRVADFIWELFNSTGNAGNPSLLAMRDFGEGTVIIEVWLDDEDHLRRIEFNWDIVALDIDLADISQLYAGNILDEFSISQSTVVELGSYEAEFDPIEIPSEPLEQ